MADNDLFAADSTDGVFDSNLITIDPDKDYFTEFVGEGKKYRDNQAAGRALAEKDAFIERLKNENKGMREDLNQRKTAAELFDQFKALAPTKTEDNQDRHEEQPDKNSLTPEQLKQLINQELSHKEVEASKSQNYKDVVTVLQERFGENAQRKIAQKASELGVDGNFLKVMATDQPKVFLSLFDGVKETEEELFSSVAPRNALNTNTQQKASVGRTKAFYDQVKKDDVKKYWSIETQAQMHKDAMRLGEKFYT